MVKIITVYGNMLLTAMGRTLLLAFLGLVFACILGMIFGLLSVLKNKACNIISNIFVFVIRGVPMIVLAFFIYFGIPYLINTILGFGGGFTLSALQAGTICLALNCGAYMAEIIRSGIQSVDKGQNEAAMSLGMTTMQTLMYVVFPQAIKNSFPSIGNQLIVNIKDSSMLNVITVTELYFQTTSVAGSNYRVMETFLVSAILYLILTTLASFLLNYLEKRMDSESSMKDFCS